MPKPGWVVIRIKAFGLNRAELFTRRGDSPGVEFPRVIADLGVALKRQTDRRRVGRIVVVAEGRSL